MDYPCHVLSQGPIDQQLTVHARTWQKPRCYFFTYVCYIVPANENFVDCNSREQREYDVFQWLLHTVLGLEAQIMEGSDENTCHIAELVHALYDIYSYWLFGSYILQIQKGASSVRLDNTKSLKAAVLDWITPWGQPLNPFWPVMSKSTVDFVTNAQECCYVLQAWNGPIPSMWIVGSQYMLLKGFQGQREAVEWWDCSFWGQLAHFPV